MTHIHTTPTFALRQLARCIWRVTIDLGEELIYEARKVAKDRTERSAAKRRYGSW